MVSTSRRRFTPDEQAFVQTLVDVNSIARSSFPLRVGCGTLFVGFITASWSVGWWLAGGVDEPLFRWLTVGFVAVLVLAVVLLDRSEKRDATEHAARARDALETGEVEVVRYQSSRVLVVRAPPSRGGSIDARFPAVDEFYFDLGDGRVMRLEGPESKSMPNDDFEIVGTPNKFCGFSPTPRGARMTPITVIVGEAATRIRAAGPPYRVVIDGSLETLETDLDRWNRQHSPRGRRTVSS